MLDDRRYGEREIRRGMPAVPMDCSFADCNGCAGIVTFRLFCAVSVGTPLRAEFRPFRRRVSHYGAYLRPFCGKSAFSRFFAIDERSVPCCRGPLPDRRTYPPDFAVPAGYEFIIEARVRPCPARARSRPGAGDFRRSASG